MTWLIRLHLLICKVKFILFIPLKLLLLLIHSVMSNSLRTHGLQDARLPCPSPIPGTYSNSCSSSQWCLCNYLILCCPLLLLPSIFPSIRVCSNESVLCIRWPKYWSFSFGIRPFNECSGLISFRMDLFDLLAVQGTQEFSLIPQCKSINSLLLSILYSPTLTSIHDEGKNHSLD